MIKEIIELILISIFIVMVPVYGHVEVYDIIDDKKFKRIKLKKFKNMFKAIGFQDVSTHGIIVPLFWMQLMSYFLSLLTLIIGIICIINRKNSVIISLIILGVETFAFLILIIVLSIISKKRKKK
ncbi:MAG: hypothetical protein IJV77_07650 [Clostridia bacterium]|nr:hypothetical protein [Clostridia bacterium]